MSQTNKIIFVSNSNFSIPISLQSMIFLPINSVRPYNLSLKYQRFATSSCNGLENLSLCQKLNSFAWEAFLIQYKPF